MFCVENNDLPTTTSWQSRQDGEWNHNLPSKSLTYKMHFVIHITLNYFVVGLFISLYKIDSDDLEKI